jgi:C1A family cysteine protease
MKMLLKRGVCRESFWPYKPHQSDRPKTGASKDAKRYKIIAYARLHTVLEMKRSLVVNGPFLAGVDVYESWFTDTASRTGMIPMPKRGDQYQGGHAICIVGYDDSKKLFRFKNSWGTTWGSKGYGYLSYDYLKSYCMDAWSATDLIEDPKLIVAKREVLLEQYV